MDGLDFGIYQLCTTKERADIKGSLFWSLVSLGDHALHHMFPTLDQAILPLLEPHVIDICKQFNVGIQSSLLSDHITGVFEQLARVEPKQHASLLK